MSQDVVYIKVYIKVMNLNEEGYGKDEKLKGAYHFPTTSTAATGVN